jgi:NADH dehydrogenase [ubiquinone] 1 alpha subcomplex assembly factor 1
MVVLFDFDSEAECNSWMPINDVVMGGISVSIFEYLDPSSATFTGIVSLENSGGFASVRSAPSLYDLRDYAGLKLRVRGDGKKYKMNLRTEAAMDGVQYQALFEPRCEMWSEIMIPFSEFVPMFRGARVHHAPSLDTASLCTFGFLISNKQAGSFRMDIDWIGAYP